MAKRENSEVTLWQKPQGIASWDNGREDKFAENLEVLMGDVLVLNGGYQPLRIIPWQRAISLWYLGKVEIVEQYENTLLRSQKLAVQMPAVIRLITFFKGVEWLHRASPALSRRNVYERDKGRCQYCGKKVTPEGMTLDHVIPRSMGGRKEWKNIVACCMTCNTRKAGRTPKQAAMTLGMPPFEPSAHHLIMRSETWHPSHPSWQNYLCG